MTGMSHVSGSIPRGPEGRVAAGRSACGQQAISGQPPLCRQLTLQFDPMREFERIVHLGGCFAAGLILLAHAMAQVASEPQESASCRRFVQQYYDWYVPLIQKMRDERTSDVALRRKAEVFNPDLLRALKADSEAAARAKGEIDGLDFDPFAGDQDPADHYEARRVTCRDNKCSVEVWRASPTDTAAKPGKPDVVAELALDRGHWQFVNFRYPQVNADLVSVLARLREERRKH